MDRTAQYITRRCMSLAQLRSSPNISPSSSIRKLFVDYFSDLNHAYIKSSPVFSNSDPTLAFVNAGMNQFRGVFLEQMQPPAPRVVNYQKCIRIFGKHNDLSQVGNDGTHHTFFEMLGNWSFNDYFKEDACKMAWDFLTQVCKLSKERLYVTYFGGDEKLCIPPDNEVKEIWRAIGVEESHILPFGMKENFWEAKSTGPCGPCTEIHYDNIPGRTNAGALVNTGNSELTELWNLVFIQYNRKSENELEKLKKHYVDTGMGFERLVAVMQGKTSNYETDLFLPLFGAIQKITGHSGYTGKYDGNVVDSTYRILADHSRMISVALADGMIPSQHHKVRTMIRRSVIMADRVFDSKKNILNELTKYVAETLSEAYPEVGNNLFKINFILKYEEEHLRQRMEDCRKGWSESTKNFPELNKLDIAETPNMLGAFNYLKKNYLKKDEKVIGNEGGWVMHNTLGASLEEIEKLAGYLNLKFDRKSFEDYVKRKKMNLMQQNLEEFEENDIDPELKVELANTNLQPTVDCFKYEYRTDEKGKYIFAQQPATIVGIVCKNKLVDEISSSDDLGAQVGLILDRTQFFSKDQDQESDSGRFEIENKIHFNVDNVIKFKGLAIHFGTFTDFPRGEKVAVNNIGVLHLNESKRLNTMRNHTALHILNKGVKKSLVVCEKKSSFVSSSHTELKVIWYGQKLNYKVVNKLQTYVNDFIKHGVPVKTRYIPLNEFYNEKNIFFEPGDQPLTLEVPVVEINSGSELSKEYCRGTHVLNTADIGNFVITRFSAGQYGTSSITGVSGEEAAEIIENDKKAIQEFGELENELQNPSLPKDKALLKIQNFRQNVLHKKRKLSFRCSHKITKTLYEHKYEIETKKTDKGQGQGSDITSGLMENLKSNDFHFIVYSMEKPVENYSEFWESLPVECRSKPILLFNRIEGKVEVVGILPYLYTEKEFTSEEWVTASIGKFGFYSDRSKTLKKPNVFSAFPIELNAEELNKAMELAVFYAKRHFTD